MEWRIVLVVLPTLFPLTCGTDGTMIGGRDEINIFDKDHRMALQDLTEAVNEHNKRSNCKSLYKAKVVKAEVQVVEGLMYIIKVETTKTSCNTGSDPGLCMCFEDPNMAEPYECTFRVWSRPWLEDKTKKILYQKCPGDEDWKTLGV